jgi:hypothetical protein
MSGPMLDGIRPNRSVLATTVGYFKKLAYAHVQMQFSQGLRQKMAFTA